jgi:hypothetical protein
MTLENNMSISVSDQSYYSQEACGYFALALNELYNYPIYVLIGSSEDSDYDVTVAHVFCKDNSGNAIDVKGKRNIDEIKSYYYDLINPEVRKVSAEELISEYMGDDKPLFAYSSKEVEDAKELILENEGLFMPKFSKILQACAQFSRLVVLAKQKPIYMYHGTSSKNLPSILSQGLITDPSKKVWETDEYASFSIPSRASVGGIYFTKNIKTAISSANNAIKDKEKENRIIIIAEIKPGSLYADEDLVPSAVSVVRMPEAVPNENISCYLWAYLYVDPTNSDLISAQDLYINNSIQRIKEELKMNKVEELHPKLERRLKDLFEEGFFIALKRQVSHINDYDYRRGIDRVLGRGQSIEKPNKDEAEREYSEYLDRLTRLLRKLAISEISREYGLRSGRIAGDVRYSGGNRIVGILKLSPVKSLDYGVEVIYEAPGGIPEEAFNDFIAQYSEQMTKDFELIRPEKKSYFLSSEIIKSAEEQLSLFSDEDLEYHSNVKDKTSLKYQLIRLRSAMAKAAQLVYDEWSPDEEGLDDVYGSGGICDDISREISSIIYEKVKDVDIMDGGQDGDDHAYLIVYNDIEAYIVDIPPGVYEEGSGYNWQKKPNVIITAEDVAIEPIKRSDLDLS